MKVSNEIFFAAVEERLEAGERVKITLVGTSMRPTLIEGDVLTLEPLTCDPKLGDIVLFRYQGRHILHRIVAIEDGVYTMRGDNSVTFESCRREDVVARVVEVEKNNKLKHFVVRWLGHKGRRQLRPWYFATLAILMWAPLNGLGIPLDNYIFGLRADHLLHASVFIPCALFLWDIIGPKWLVWLASVAVGLVTEGGQCLLPYRGYDVNDLVANAIGVTLGFVAIILFRRAVRRRRQCPGRAKRGGCR